MNSHIPLAERIRPQSLDEVVGQDHLVGKGSILRTSIQQGKIPSIIFWGPPGTGKTTLANIIANTLKVPFYSLSAISAGVKEVREVIEKSRSVPGSVLFIDEIHRFNKGQQDALLGAVEKGIIRLIGATTENPSFEVNSALLSRCQVYVLKPLDENNLTHLLQYAIDQDEDLKKKTIRLTNTNAMINLSGGDARKLLNLLELVVDTAPNDLDVQASPNELDAEASPSPSTGGVLETSKKKKSLQDSETENPLLGGRGAINITDELVMEVAQKRIAVYDKSGEQHYDIISAFIKSIRGSDPNAAVYWLARMIDGGEDVKFIARRLVILASEDIGNANPTALVLANAAFEAVNKIGYPEASIILSQCSTYLASSPKSNAAVAAIGEAQSEVSKTGDLPVPLHIRNAPTRLMKNMGYGKNYEYSHAYEKNFSAQEYLPDAIAGKKFYDPGKNAREEEIRKFLRDLWGKKYGY